MYLRRKSHGTNQKSVKVKRKSTTKIEKRKGKSIGKGTGRKSKNM